jgi:4-oxalomesaconate tautomerase
MLTAVPATLMRGGTSKGLYLEAKHLPKQPSARDAVLLALMGSPDVRQIDGLGGAHPLTSKVAVLAPPSRADADIDYLFLQVGVDRAEVSDSQNCGNILAGVGPWAIEQGWVKPEPTSTPVRIHMLNTKTMAVAHVPTAAGRVVYTGDARIDGVPGSAAPIMLEFLDVAGATTGALFPTGERTQVVDGLNVTCIDCGMPVILLRAEELGVKGDESPHELEHNASLCARLEAVRLALGPAMRLGDVAKKTVPKLTIVSPARHGGTLNTRTFIPRRVHEAIGVLGATSVAAACGVAGTIVSEAQRPSEGSTRFEIEHPTGAFVVEMAFGEPGPRVERAALLRTARLLMRGDAYAPSNLWDDSALSSSTSKAAGQ